MGASYWSSQNLVALFSFLSLIVLPVQKCQWSLTYHISQMDKPCSSLLSIISRPTDLLLLLFFALCLQHRTDRLKNLMVNAALLTFSLIVHFCCSSKAWSSKFGLRIAWSCGSSMFYSRYFHCLNNFLLALVSIEDAQEFICLLRFKTISTSTDYPYWSTEQCSIMFGRQIINTAELLSSFVTKIIIAPRQAKKKNYTVNKLCNELRAICVMRNLCFS
jgi:hypothetical protein